MLARWPFSLRQTSCASSHSRFCAKKRYSWRPQMVHPSLPGIALKKKVDVGSAVVVVVVEVVVVVV